MPALEYLIVLESLSTDLAISHLPRELTDTPSKLQPNGDTRDK